MVSPRRPQVRPAHRRWKLLFLVSLVVVPLLLVAGMALVWWLEMSVNLGRGVPGAP